MRNLLIFIFYSLALILIGRQLVFLPIITPIHTKEFVDAETLKQDTVELLASQKGKQQYSVYYEDLTTGDYFGIQENTILTAASLNKLGIIGYLYNVASKNEINLEDKIVIQKEDIQDYGTGSLRYATPGGTYTLKYLAQLALQQSDNTAAHVLELRLEEKNVQFYVTTLGMGATSMVNNETSARDMGIFLRSLYKKRITNPSLTQEILGYMTDTDFEDRLPRYLPKTYKTHHKTGDAVGLIHDAGIIDDGVSPFILVVMGSNIEDENLAKDTIGKIAKLITDKRSEEK